MEDQYTIKEIYTIVDSNGKEIDSNFGTLQEAQVICEALNEAYERGLADS